MGLEYLNEAFYKDVADEYYLHGIPPELEGELKGAEKDLIVRREGNREPRLTNEQRLKYIGRKTIAKYAHKATVEEIKENENNLNIARYVDTFAEEESVDLHDVQEEITRLERELTVTREEVRQQLEKLGL